MDTIFFYYYFALLSHSDISNTNPYVTSYIELFQLIHDKYWKEIFKSLEPTNSGDQLYVKSIERMIKFIDDEKNEGKSLFSIRNLLVSNFNNELTQIFSHPEFSKKFKSLSDLENYLLRPDLIRDFVKTLTIYVKNILSIKYINVLTNTLISNISDNELKNMMKVTQKFEEIVHEFLNEENILNINQLTLNKDTISNITDIERTLSSIIVEKIPSGFMYLDNVTNGGFQKGRVYLILGKTGQGKSSFLISLVRNFLEQNKRILFYTFENTTEETIERLFANISQIPMSQFPSRKDEVINKVKTFFYNSNGVLHITYSPADTITIPMIKEKAKLLNVDVIIVDYLDLLKYSKNVEERIRTMKLTRGLKNLAQETNTVVITPTQVHRSAYRSKIVEVDNVAESFGKISEADGVLILETTVDEIKDGKIRLYIGKMRHGTSGVRIDMNVNFDTMTFTEIGFVNVEDFEEIGTTKTQKKRKTSTDDIIIVEEDENFEF